MKHVANSLRTVNAMNIHKASKHPRKFSDDKLKHLVFQTQTEIDQYKRAIKSTQLKIEKEFLAKLIEYRDTFQTELNKRENKNESD